MDDNDSVIIWGGAGLPAPFSNGGSVGKKVWVLGSVVAGVAAAVTLAIMAIRRAAPPRLGAPKPRKK